MPDNQIIIRFELIAYIFEALRDPRPEVWMKALREFWQAIGKPELSSIRTQHVTGHYITYLYRLSVERLNPENHTCVILSSELAFLAECISQIVVRRGYHVENIAGSKKHEPEQAPATEPIMPKGLFMEEAVDKYPLAELAEIWREQRKPRLNREYKKIPVDAAIAKLDKAISGEDYGSRRSRKATANAISAIMVARGYKWSDLTYESGSDNNYDDVEELDAESRYQREIKEAPYRRTNSTPTRFRTYADRLKGWE